ncbi:hypothetical protein CMEL01_00618 [Colletotrichum melonis]|uniref:Ankyrin repeat protein n=2 Tax=Colletotrichum acutatum species complex TaxID=2707335 RepID=A0AAI9XYJ4_9PEZI|nr:hypothetical protein CMEL01_00618 [Colletotrichum melonis]
MDLVRRIKWQTGTEGAGLLCVAAEEGNVAIISLLLVNGADPHFADKTGQTPLWVAAGKGHLDATRSLVDAGARVDMINSADQSPLFIAAAEGHSNVVQYLLQVGADSKLEDQNGRTPLAFAVYRSHEDVVRLLMDYSTTKTRKHILSGAEKAALRPITPLKRTREWTIPGNINQGG